MKVCHIFLISREFKAKDKLSEFLDLFKIHSLVIIEQLMLL